MATHIDSNSKKYRWNCDGKESIAMCNYAFNVRSHSMVQARPVQNEKISNDLLFYWIEWKRFNTFFCSWLEIDTPCGSVEWIRPTPRSCSPTDDDDDDNNTNKKWFNFNNGFIWKCRFLLSEKKMGNMYPFFHPESNQRKISTAFFPFLHFRCFLMFFGVWKFFLYF